MVKEIEQSDIVLYKGKFYTAYTWMKYKEDWKRFLTKYGFEPSLRGVLQYKQEGSLEIDLIDKDNKYYTTAAVKDLTLVCTSKNRKILFYRC